MKFSDWFNQLKEKQETVNKKALEHEGAKEDLRRFVGESVSVDLGAPIGIDAVAGLAAKIFDMKKEE